MKHINMKRLKLFYYFCREQLMAITGSSTERRTLERSESGCVTFCNKPLYRKEKDLTPLKKKFMTHRENKRKASERLLKALQGLEHSDYEVTPQGKLCYKKLIGLELNAVYECSLGLMFGYEA